MRAGEILTRSDKYRRLALPYVRYQTQAKTFRASTGASASAQTLRSAAFRPSAVGAAINGRLRQGKLFDAIRASIATPLIFTPFKHGERTLLDGGLVNPVPVGPTLNDTTDITVAVNLSGAVEARPSPAPSAPTLDGNAHRLRIRAFIEGLHLSRVPAGRANGIFNIAFASMEAMQNTIARLKLAAYSPDVTVEIPRNACGFHEFWRAEELIELGRERTARAFAATEH